MISIHALLAESDDPSGKMHYMGVFISIHALLAESDLFQVIRSQGIAISIHALLAESDHRGAVKIADAVKFLSTLSLRRATSKTGSAANWSSDFYPRSPCGERHPGKRSILYTPEISIHALLAESDASDACNGCNPDFISIHALLAESDL